MLRTARGFTLIELMVVITILGLLVAIVAPNVWRSSDTANRKTAEIQMAAVADAVRLYTIDVRRLPSTLDDLVVPPRDGREAFLETLPKDPWGSLFEYRVTDASHRRFEIVCAGPDRVMGTEDDLRWPARVDGGPD
jgi:general secretion pathway protein G